MAVRLRIDPDQSHAPEPVQGRGAVVPPAPALPVLPYPRTPVQAGFRLMLSSVALTVGLVIGVGVMEYVNPYEQAKPSWLIGTLGGRLAAAELQAVEKAKAAFTEGVKAGELRAQVAYDERLLKLQLEKETAFATVQADLDRTSKAYEALYQVSVVTSQAAMTMEADLARTRSTTVAQSQGARTFMANIADFVGVIGTLGGDQTLAGVNGDSFRQEMSNNITAAGTSGAGAMASRILSQFPSPAEFRVNREATLQKAFAPAR